MISGIRIINVNQKVFSLLRFLHHGSGGLTSVYQDEQQSKYILKSTLGEDTTYEAALNARLGRLVLHVKAEKNCDRLLLKYIEGVDVERFMALHLSQPPMDDIGCALFDPHYLRNPYSNYPTGLDRNIAIAIELVNAQEALLKQDIVHNDIQLANYVINETEQGFKIEGIDLASAIDLSNKNIKDKERIIRENISSLIEALKAILPRVNYNALLEELANKRLTYSTLNSALALQLSVKPQIVKSYTPSFASPRIPVLPEVTVNRRHIQFIQNRLSNAIRKNNLQEANEYLLHGGRLDEAMLKVLMSDSHRQLRDALKPYIDEYQEVILSAGIRNLSLKPNT